MLALMLLTLFVVLLVLHFRKATKVEETLLISHEFRDYPFAIEWRLKPLNTTKEKWSKWRHVSGYRSDTERQKTLAAMHVDPRCMQIRLVNYRRIYPRAG